jgi:hypothetical protein
MLPAAQRCCGRGVVSDSARHKLIQRGRGPLRRRQADFTAAARAPGVPVRSAGRRHRPVPGAGHNVSAETLGNCVKRLPPERPHLPDRVDLRLPALSPTG